MHKKKKCIKCDTKFSFDSEEDCRWDFLGVTPTKIVKCKSCECLQAVSYVKENNVNYDERYYAYRPKYHTKLPL